MADAQDQPLPAGDIGAIQVRGAGVFAGYWRMLDKSAQAFTPDGWFRTGSVGQGDERGYVSIVGRSNDLIISGAYIVYPAESEAALNQLPGELESAVAGVPHLDFGEVGVAVVVLRKGATVEPETLLAALKSQLANFKIPKHCTLAPELPRNALGKVQKNVWRGQFGAWFAPDS